MAIKKFYSNKAKPGWRWDDKAKKFTSWGYDIRFEDGTRKRENGFASKQLAENAVARIRISEKEGKYDLARREYPHVSEVLEKRIPRIESDKERIRAVTILNRWLEMLPPNLKINELTAAHIRLYINDRITEVKAVSVNREITVIASALHSAHVDFPELETWTCPKIPRPKVERSRRERLITQEEIMKVLTELFSPRKKDESEKDFNRRRIVGQVFQMALLTGARVGEITALRWEQIDFKARIVQIIGRKNRFKVAKTVRYLELTPTMEEILLERKKINAFGEYVFCRTGNSVTNYHQIMRRTAKSVGVPYGAKTRGGFITHDARHTAVTRMLQAGVDLSTVGAITGHSDSQLILHYSHATRESRKQAVSILENFVVGEAEKKEETRLPEKKRVKK
jgi:integrase